MKAPSPSSLSVSPVVVCALLLLVSHGYVSTTQVTPAAPSSSVQHSFYNETPTTTPVTDTTPTSQCDCVCGQYGRHMRIVGGEEAAAHEFPWIVMLSYRGKFYCGGTLITPRHVLTAAHCTQQVRKEHVQVTVGEHNRSDSAVSVQTRGVSKMTPHKQFSLSTFNHDIAVLQLDSPIVFSDSTIRPACLPDSDDEDYSGRSATVAGWGRLAERKQTSETLQKVAVPIMSTAECKTKGYPGNKITDNMICAGYPIGKKDACQGDSGGPLHAKDANNVTEVIGIVSWGRGCARPNYPGVYTRVARYTEWIDERLDGECRCTRRPPPRHRAPRDGDGLLEELELW